LTAASIKESSIKAHLMAQQAYASALPPQRWGNRCWPTVQTSERVPTLRCPCAGQRLVVCSATSKFVDSTSNFQARNQSEHVEKCAFALRYLFVASKEQPKANRCSCTVMVCACLALDSSSYESAEAAAMSPIGENTVQAP
jgi:hypothetical protein